MTNNTQHIKKIQLFTTTFPQLFIPSSGYFKKLQNNGLLKNIKK